MDDLFVKRKKKNINEHIPITIRKIKCNHLHSARKVIIFDFQLLNFIYIFLCRFAMFGVWMKNALLSVHQIAVGATITVQNRHNLTLWWKLICYYISFKINNRMDCIALPCIAAYRVRFDADENILIEIVFQLRSGSLSATLFCLKCKNLHN